MDLLTEDELMQALKKMGRDQMLAYHQMLLDKKRLDQMSLIELYFPDKGPLRRELYPKHMKFFELGKKFEERLALAANRIGKTETMGGFELVCHLTGNYPIWWPGRKFDRPVTAWASGKTGQTVRDIIQLKLLGPPNAIGTGLIKKELIHGTTSRHGIPDAVEKIMVKHTSGGISEVGFKSYDQRRQSFEGTKKDIIWMDEECPLEIYSECLLRTADTSGSNNGNGILMLTFTPLLGLSELVLQFLPNGEMTESRSGSKAVIMASWDDAPHLSEETKEKLLASIPEFQRDARSKGLPQLGSGAIYPVNESDLVVPDMEIPAHWPRAYALDVGWNRTACLWAALNRETDVLYLYSEHYMAHAEPSVHAQSIMARGKWICGTIDPASRGRSQRDGSQLMDIYRDLGLDLTPAQNMVEAGIFEVWQRMAGGRLKVFKSLNNFLGELRLYRRDERGKIVKANDHLMDCLKYMQLSGIDRMKTKPVEKKQAIEYRSGGMNDSWMG